MGKLESKPQRPAHERRAGPLPMALSSGPPWHITLTVEGAGGDCVCHIQRGDWHVGAEALSRWQGGRAHTECLGATAREEEEIAVHAAHKLAKASRGRVTCMVGIHSGAIPQSAIDHMLEGAMRLVNKAERELEICRLRQNLLTPHSLYSRVTSGPEEILREIDVFMRTRLDELLGEQPSTEAFTGHFHREVRLFAPLYLSNACPNDCAYCGFRRSARFKRMRLGVDEALEDARHLIRQGHRTIDLVSSEISTDRFVDYVCEIIERTLETTGIHSINLNLGALSEKQYRRLREAGATGYHLYQETYDSDLYFQLHRTGLKRDMANRLEAPHRAMKAGFRRIGLGVLLGLRPLRDDLARLVRHGQIVASDYPNVQIGFSLPRLRKVDPECDYTAAAPVSDEQFIKAMIFLRRKFPTAHLTLTTRERPEIRDRLIPLGITKISAGVSTRPGGYSLDDSHGTAQFDVSDERPLAEIVDVIQRAGLTAVYG